MNFLRQRQYGTSHTFSILRKKQILRFNSSKFTDLDQIWLFGTPPHEDVSLFEKGGDDIFDYSEMDRRGRSHLHSNCHQKYCYSLRM